MAGAMLTQEKDKEQFLKKLNLVRVLYPGGRNSRMMPPPRKVRALDGPSTSATMSFLMARAEQREEQMETEDTEEEESSESFEEEYWASYVDQKRKRKSERRRARERQREEDHRLKKIEQQRKLKEEAEWRKKEQALEKYCKDMKVKDKEEDGGNAPQVPVRFMDLHPKIKALEMEERAKGRRLTEYCHERAVELQELMEKTMELEECEQIDGGPPPKDKEQSMELSEAEKLIQEELQSMLRGDRKDEVAISMKELNEANILIQEEVKKLKL